MSQDPDGCDDAGRLSKRRAAVIVLIVLAITGAVIGAVFLSGAQTTEPYHTTPVTTYNASDGPEVHVEEDLDNTTVRQPFPNPNRVELYIGAYVRSDGPTELHLRGIRDEWTNASALEVSENELRLNMIDKQAVNVSGDANYVEYRDATLDDGGVDVRYSADGTTTLHIEALPADTDVAAWSQSGQRLDWATTDSSGMLVLELPAGEHDVELREANEPAFDESTADPTGPQSTYPEDLSIDVEHEDFPATDVTVEFFLNGESIGTDTLTEAGTATVDAPDHIPGGSNTWNATVTDDYGHDASSSTFEFSVPSELEIRDEENPSELVTEANATLEFYFSNGEEQIIERDASDGTVDMEGLPTDQSFVAIASADDYVPRRIFVRSLFESQHIYLLNESTEYVDVTFQLEDFTGDYPEEDTVLEIERNINGSWGTVQGDFFGATGQWTAQLSFNTRHRLTLLNTETGEERDVGTFTPVSSSVQTIRILRSDTEISDVGPRFVIEPSTRTLPATETSVRTTLHENDREVDSWSMTVTYTNSTGSVQLYDETFDEAGTQAAELNLTGLEGGTVAVETTATTASGEELNQRVTYRVSEFYQHDNSLLAISGRVPDALGLGEGGTVLLAMLIVLIATTAIAAATPVSTEFVGAIPILFSIVFAAIGWVSWQLVAALGITYAATWAMWRGI